MEESNPPLSLADVRRIIEPLYEGQVLFTGEPVMSHAEGVVDILRLELETMTIYWLPVIFFFVWDRLKNPKEWLTKHFGRHVCELVTNLKVVLDVSEKARSREGEAKSVSNRKLSEDSFSLFVKICGLFFSDLPQDFKHFVILPLLRLRALRSMEPETLALYSPLANRLGIWQMKWELEDLSLRFTKPKEFAQIAVALEETRERRELPPFKRRLNESKNFLVKNGIQASVSGRPKHIYSIWKKMCKKNLKFEQLYDVRAVRIIVDSVEKCYETLSLIQRKQRSSL